MPRIKPGCRVSTEAWRFDNKNEPVEKRWSFLVYGDKCQDSRVHGTVARKIGEKWLVQWEDGTETTFESAFLLYEELPDQQQSKMLEPELREESDSESVSDDNDSDYELPPKKSRTWECAVDGNESRICQSDFESSASTSDQTVSSEFQLNEGEEVFLKKADKKLFKALFKQVELGLTVSFEPVTSSKGKFEITKVYHDVKNWGQFDEDIHCEGSFILWPLRHVQRIPLPTLLELDLGTMAREPMETSQRKRKRNPKKWKKSVAKEQLNLGIRKKGEIIKSDDRKQQRPKEPCTRCKKQCKLFSDDDRKKLHDSFWDLNDWALQTAFITERVKEEPKQRKRIRHHTKSGQRRNRISTRRYTLLLNSTEVVVCPTFFLSTLHISEKRVRYALAKKKNEAGIPAVDLRGNNNGNNRISEERIAPVVEHIKSFKTVESHYVRKESKFQYSPEDLNIRKMWKMYKDMCVAKSVEYENEQFYRKVFVEKFNLKFHRLKKDACDKCTSFLNTPDERRTDAMCEEFKSHQNEKEAAREFKNKMKEEAKDKSNFAVACFDMEKVLLLPHGPTSSFYYAYRLRVANLTITDINSMTTHCYLWDESHAKKGACEVASSVLKFLEKMKSRGKTNIHLFSDRCTGQNNNRMVIVMLSLALNALNFEEITMNYLVTGHSQNENDSAHSAIEKKTVNQTIYTMAQWEMAIKMAFSKHTPEVQELKFNDIKNFKDPESLLPYAHILQKPCYEKNNDRDRSACEKVSWSKIMQIKFTKQEPEAMLFKYSYLDAGFRTVDFRKLPQCTRRSREQ